MQNGRDALVASKPFPELRQTKPAHRMKLYITMHQGHFCNPNITMELTI